MERPKTIFCDIDGTLWDHVGDITEQVNVESHKLLSNTSDALNRWDKLGYKIILTTGRRESMRDATVAHLKKIGIVYDILIMGLGGGARVLVNDRKPNSRKNTAFSMNLVRNEGLQFFDFSSDFCVLPNLEKDKIVTKTESREIVEYNDNYILSKIELFSSNSEILMSHKLMRKTFCIFEGKVTLSLGDRIQHMEERILEPGDTITINPMTYYSLNSQEGCKYFETSTTEIWE